MAVLEGGYSLAYSKGALCYTFGQSQVRVLDFNESRVEEWCFDIRHLLRTRLTQLRKGHKHKFRVLHVAENLLSCLYSSKPEPMAVLLHWLVVIDVKNRDILTIYELNRIDDIWVRNTRDWLYCGISSEAEDEDVRSWVLFQLNAQNGQWATNRIMVPEMPHGDLGVGNCFEILDEYLYGGSSRMPANLEDPYDQACSSFYYVTRFPLGKPEHKEVMDEKALWRRWLPDGNVDDRWGSLQLVKDEVDGEIYLYESRREFLETRPQSQRNCYRKRVTFTQRQPDEPWSDPGDVHHGDDWYLDTTYKVREAPIRTYVPSCRIFLDVISQPEDFTVDKPSLYVRIRPRDSGHLRPRAVLNSTSLGSKAVNDEPKADHGVYVWPSKQDLLDQGKQLNAVLDMLHPDTAAQQVDERFIVYAVKAVPGKMPRRLVVISFDPSVRLPGAGDWHDLRREAVKGDCGMETEVPLTFRVDFSYHKSSLLGENKKRLESS